jgi:replicative DNA helicase
MSKSGQTNPKKGTVKKSKPIDEHEGNTVKKVFEEEIELFDLPNKPLHIKLCMGDFVDKIEEVFEYENKSYGLPTGFEIIDEITAGLYPGELIILASGVSVGKSALALNIAENIALSQDKPVLVFSLEMTKLALTMRLLSSLSSIDQYKFKTGKLDDDDWPRLTSAINELARTKLFINDTPELSINELRERAIQLEIDEGQLSLIVVDYLQLMGSTLNNENREQQLAEITRGLKSLARELNIPIIATSQLNRNFEKRPNKRPVMSDLRDSGAIEQDADLIAFVYRDELYNHDSPDKNIAEIAISKHRNGPLGTVRLGFVPHFTRFYNL